MNPEARQSAGGGPGRRLTADFAVARALLLAASVEEAALPVLQAVCECTGWDEGTFWLVSPENGELCWLTSWSAERPDAALAGCRDGGPSHASELADRARQSGASETVDVIAHADERFDPRTKTGRSHAAAAFPILVGGGVFGVMEFRAPANAFDGPARAMMTTVSGQIARFIESERTRTNLSQLYAMSLDMLCIAGYDAYMKSVNPAWTTVLGYSEAELLAQPWAAFVHPDDLEKTIAVASALFAGETVVNFENRYIHRDGSIRWLLWTAAAPMDGQQVVYAAARDVTELKAADELRVRTANLALLDELLGALVDSADLREVFARMSAVARKVLAYDGAALMLRLSDGDRPRIYASVGFPPDVQRVDEIPAEVLANPGPPHDIVDDLTQLSAPGYARLIEIGFKSLLRVPIGLEGRFAGALIFASRTTARFGPGDVLVANRIASRLAISIASDREVQASKRADEATARAMALEARVRMLTDELNSIAGFHRVIGQSVEWRHALRQAAQVAATDTTVLLLGESGTGKEVVARFAHRASPRKNGPFVALNCAALPEQLLEAELFGYERGAYTGATHSKPGQLEQAAGGTLFLDEVGEMSLAAQAKFLRVLQEREFQRLGGTRVLRSDARIIAATNRDVPRAIATGQFREDLYYRLNVFAIWLPPLRDRRDDILALSDAFLTDIGKGLGRPPGGISREARQQLLAYHWPGNVRELRNILERAAILCDGSLITPEHLAIGIPVPPSAPERQAQEAPDGAASGSGTPAATAGHLDAMERAMIEEALQQARFNKSKAATILGLTRKQLYVRLRKHRFE